LSRVLAAGGVARYCESLHGRYKQLTKGWTRELNAEWLARHYLALKMILSATLLAATRDQALAGNLQAVEPYLSYYGALSVCRAIQFTLPEQAWNGGELVGSKHPDIIKAAKSTLRSLSPSYGDRASVILAELKA